MKVRRLIAASLVCAWLLPDGAEAMVAAAGPAGPDCYTQVKSGHVPLGRAHKPPRPRHPRQKAVHFPKQNPY